MSNSIGNLKNSGLQGNNFPWQLKMLQGQQCACDYLKEIDLNTDQIEPLLVQILAAVQDGTDYEAALVVDANDVTWLEVRIWDPIPAPGAFLPPVYFAAGSNTPGTPLAPITYINPNTYLAQIVSNTTGLATELTLGDIKTSVQLIDNCVGVDGTAAPTNSFLVAGVTSGGVQQTIEVTASGHVNIADGGGSITVDGTVSLSPTTLTALENITVQNPGGASAVNIQDGGNSITVDAVDLDIRDLDCTTDSVSICGFDGANNIPILVDSVGAVAIQDNGNFISVDSGAIQKTQNILRISGTSGVLAPGIYSAMSFASVGTTNATVDSVILKPGETINIDAGGIDNVLGGLSYDTTNVGSELLIVTLT